ncbi:hypothetical protein BDY21DRAFT_366853 [Lineolata rhizophorae]|uniref:Peroxisomal biogenesis factor 11 n=1 Tax=Lineolata rhizophorae TaxID=578093 RepID=A0A6A6NQ74_9PEZI|nr:hypothetical protein BDY21DRAFT_366853 [Lineolata rhizophorae]
MSDVEVDGASVSGSDEPLSLSSSSSSASTSSDPESTKPDQPSAPPPAPPKDARARPRALFHRARLLLARLLSRLPALSSRAVTALRLRLRLLLARLDAFLVRLDRTVSTPPGIDAVLLTLNYVLVLLHSSLAPTSSLLAGASAPPSRPLPRALLRLLAPRGEEGATKAAAATTKAAAEAAKAAADLIADVRIFARLWGLLPVYAWGRATLAGHGHDAVTRRLALAQVAACAAFQALENAAYLAQHGVVSARRWTAAAAPEWTEDRAQLWLWLWSSRFWAVHVALELVRLAREWALRRAEKRRLAAAPAPVAGAGEARKAAGDGDDDDGAAAALAADAAALDEKARRESWASADKKWWADLVLNLAYAPLTVHWGLEEGLVSEAVVGLLGTVAGLVSVREKWEEAG